ncbi:hypothetical protein Dimus_037464, partial [Dionaea muscipula]
HEAAERRREVGVRLGCAELVEGCREEEVLVCCCSGRIIIGCRCSLLGREELADHPPLATVPRAARRCSAESCRCRKLGGFLPALRCSPRSSRRGVPLAALLATSDGRRMIELLARLAGECRCSLLRGSPLRCSVLVCSVARRSVARCSAA